MLNPLVFYILWNVRAGAFSSSEWGKQAYVYIETQYWMGQGIKSAAVFIEAKASM